jgi:DNA modification methylase
MNLDEIRNTVICGDCLNVMKQLPDELVNCVVTSPPYWGLRDYGVAGQFGLEKTPEEFIEKMVVLFREARRVLRKDGTLWLNLGDSYCGGGRGCDTPKQKTNRGTQDMPKSIIPAGLKPKDLCGIPWRVALALQSDGWYLRQDIIWAKPNPMPESVTDRCTKSHEYIFLLTKSARYFYDNEAIREPHVNSKYIDNEKYGTFGEHNKFSSEHGNHSIELGTVWSPKERAYNPAGRNKRSVWTIPTQAYSEAHFATFPEKLVEPCILAGCPKEVCLKCGKARVRIVEKPEIPEEMYTNAVEPIPDSIRDDGMKRTSPTKNGKGSGAKLQAFLNENPTKTLGFSDCGCGVGFIPGIVLDPFMGSGTVGYVAACNRRDYIGIELNPKYIEMAKRRIGEAETGVSVKEQKAGQGALWK